MPCFMAACPIQKIKRKDRASRTHCFFRASAPVRACCISFLRRTGYRVFSVGGTFSASLTVEAAVSLPLMIMAVWFLIFPLRVMESERRLQNRLETTAGTLAVTAYIKEAGKEILKEETVFSMLTDRYGEVTAETFAPAMIQSMPEAKLISGLYFGPDTSILSDSKGEDPAMIKAELYYSLRLPAGLIRILPVQKSMIVSRRAWVGATGGRGRSEYGSANDIPEEDRIVYIGKSSTRYHPDPNCHYLSNRMDAADVSKMTDLRNAGGGRYHACPVCKPGKTGTVYYFKNGSAYHSTPECGAITAYVKAVPLSEVAHLGPCSYCGR